MTRAHVTPLLGTPEGLTSHLIQIKRQNPSNGLCPRLPTPLLPTPSDLIIPCHSPCGSPSSQLATRACPCPALCAGLSLEGSSHPNPLIATWLPPSLLLFQEPLPREAHPGHRTPIFKQPCPPTSLFIFSPCSYHPPYDCSIFDSPGNCLFSTII